MSNPLATAPRYVAFSLVDGFPFAASHSIRKVLDIAADLAPFGIGHHPHTEVLDCDGEAEAVRRTEATLVHARVRFPTVYRAEVADSLPMVPLSVEGGVPLEPKS